eukprot:5348791-Lingulodinium_polyedra.AAC.1
MVHARPRDTSACLRAEGAWLHLPTTRRSCEFALALPRSQRAHAPDVGQQRRRQMETCTGH